MAKSNFLLDWMNLDDKLRIEFRTSLMSALKVCKLLHMQMPIGKAETAPIPPCELVNPIDVLKA